jgi:hypothetical protein
LSLCISRKSLIKVQIMWSFQQIRSEGCITSGIQSTINCICTEFTSMLSALPENHQANQKTFVFRVIILLECISSMNWFVRWYWFIWFSNKSELCQWIEQFQWKEMSNCRRDICHIQAWNSLLYFQMKWLISMT